MTTPSAQLDIDWDLFVQALEQHRLARGDMALRKVAEEVGLNVTQLSRLRAGITHLNARGLIRLCDWMDLPVETFVVVGKNEEYRAMVEMLTDADYIRATDNLERINRSLQTLAKHKRTPKG